MAGEGSRNIIQEFEERQRRIEKLKENIAEAETKMTELDHAIAEIRGRWEPRLDALVQKLSDAFAESFASINSAGQISVDKLEDEAGNNPSSASSDFDRWSIKIEVKFRQNESLAVLDSHRQSGGEHHLLPHGPAISLGITLPRRRRDQPGHGPSQRAEGA
jgi:chromosome segregation ATPase